MNLYNLSNARKLAPTIFYNSKCLKVLATLVCKVFLFNLRQFSHRNTYTVTFAWEGTMHNSFFRKKTGFFFSCADLVSSSKYRETADMYSEFGPNINEDIIEEPGFESNEGVPPPIPKRNQRVKFDGEPLARKASIESTHSKGYYYNSNIARFNV